MSTTTKTSRLKRTFNLRRGTAVTIKRLVEVDHVAPSQDALIERAIQGLARRIRDDLYARQCAEAGVDPEYVREWGEWEQGTVADEVWA